MSGLRYGVHVPSFADPGALVERGADLSGMAGTGCFVWDQILGALEPPMPIADPWMVLGAALGSAPSGSGWHGGHAAAPASAQEAGQGASHRRPPLRRRMGRSMGPGGPPDAEYARSVRPMPRGPGRAPGVAATCGRGERSSHRGRHFRADPVTFLPNPGNGRHPVWVACTWPHQRPLRRTARQDQDGVLVARRQPQTARH
jgi:hypothetical protein